MDSDTFGSWSGRSRPIASASSWNAAMKRCASASGSSPTSLARLMILSSTSVKLRTNSTSHPRCRR